MRHLAQPPEVGSEFILKVHVHTKHGHELAVRAVERVRAGREPRENFPFGELIVAVVALVDPDKFAVEIPQIHSQLRVEHSRNP